MTKVNKNCCVRLPEELHRRAKLAAYSNGITLQEWIETIITNALEGESRCPKDQKNKKFLLY